MKERPILFSGRMVRAIFDGRKTQTRRVVKPQPVCPRASFEKVGGGCRPEGFRIHAMYLGAPDNGQVIDCPYGVPGDHLWVRETFFDVRPHRSNPVFAACSGDYIYRADYEYREKTRSVIGDHKWSPSIHIPRRASRLTLEVVSVRVERLQDISEDDSKAEGIAECVIPADEDGPDRFGYMVGPDDGESGLSVTASRAFQKLWDSINGSRPKLPKNSMSKRYARVKRWLEKHPDASWSANPWVWVIEFRRCV